MNDEFEQRLEGVERLTKLFQTERMVYLIATIISLLMLVGSALSLMLKNQAAPVELSMLFGASGSIAYTTGRLLHMWSEALKRLLPISEDKEDKKEEK